MDFTKALTYPFDDPEWISKLGIAVGITLLMFIVPVIGTIIGALLFAGWGYETSKNVRNGVPNPMASWSDFGGLLGRGFQIALGYLAYQVPTILIGCVMAGALALPAMAADSDAAGALAGLTGIIQICCSCIIILYALAAAIVFSGGYLRYMDNEELGTFFQFSDNLALVRENIGDFGMAFVFILVGGFIASLLSSITFGIGLLVSQAFTSYFMAHIIGQLAAKLRGGSMMPQV